MVYTLYWFDWKASLVSTYIESCNALAVGCDPWGFCRICWQRCDPINPITLCWKWKFIYLTRFPHNFMDQIYIYAYIYVTYFGQAVPGDGPGDQIRCVHICTVFWSALMYTTSNSRNNPPAGFNPFGEQEPIIFCWSSEAFIWRATSVAMGRQEKRTISHAREWLVSSIPCSKYIYRPYYMYHALIPFAFKHVEKIYANRSRYKPLKCSILPTRCQVLSDPVMLFDLRCLGEGWGGLREVNETFWSVGPLALKPQATPAIVYHERQCCFDQPVWKVLINKTVHMNAPPIFENSI